MEQEGPVDLAAVEASIDSYIRQGNKAIAVQLLHGLAIRYAEAGAFLKADATRARIYEVDPLALTEIITSGEAIESLKHNAISRQHKEVWAHLYELLSREEGTAFYFSLKNQRIQAGQKLFSQGTKNDTLFFIDEGRLKLFFKRKDGSEEFLRGVREGEIAGEDTFFQPHLCSSTLLTDTPVNLHSLERQALDSLADSFPMLAGKIQAFCEQLVARLAAGSQQKKGLERREHQRIRLEVPITIQLVGKTGQPQGGIFPGHISDISAGGIAMAIHALKRESSRLLLGRWLRVRFTLPDPEGGEDSVVSQNALVTGLRFSKTYALGGETYTIQLSFQQLLAQPIMELANRVSVQQAKQKAS